MSKLPEKATVRELVNLQGKRVFLRADLNVPIFNGEIADETRIVASLKTLRYLIDKGARVILASHLGRPETKGQPEFSLRPVFERLKQHLPNTKISFADDVVGKSVETAAKALKNGEVLLLENLRYYKEEKKNDDDFSKKLASLADYFVNDAFGVAHRAHASTHGITKHLPAVAGFLLEKELKILGEAIANPKRPLTFIVGGKKIADKIAVLDNLLNIANTIIVGGGMTYTFVKAQGGKVGGSIVDDSKLEYCLGVLETAKKRGVKLLLAVDNIAADGFSNDAHTLVVDSNNIPDGWEGLDIGPKTIELFRKAVADSGTIMWGGPLGVFELEKFSTGTREILKAVTDNREAVTIACGGDTAYAAVKTGLADKFTHISTGGGASLEFLEGKELPAIDALLGIQAKIK